MLSPKRALQPTELYQYHLSWPWFTPKSCLQNFTRGKKKYLEDDLCLLLSVMENKDPVVATLKHAFNLKYMSSPYLPQWVWIRAIIITNHESLLSAALFFQGHLCGCLYKNTVKN